MMTDREAPLEGLDVLALIGTLAPQNSWTDTESVARAIRAQDKAAGRPAVFASTDGRYWGHKHALESLIARGLIDEGIVIAEYQLPGESGATATQQSVSLRVTGKGWHVLRACGRC